MISIWRKFQNDDFVYYSPYFCPEFTLSVGQVRDDVRIAVVAIKDEIVAFLPFQMTNRFMVKPVGGPLCDFHGVIKKKNFKGNYSDILKQVGLKTFKYHHLYINDFITVDEKIDTLDYSHFIDLSKGYESYMKTLKARGSKMEKDVNYKLRRLERDFGPVKFIPAIDDETLLDKLLLWKSEQYQMSGLVDVFSYDWTRKLLHAILKIKGENFRGVLSGLYAGDHLLALHMGMRSRFVWNWWFPRHDNRFRKFSPGIILRLKVAEYAASCGIQRIDLGCGGSSTYKPRLSSGTIPVVNGACFSRSCYQKTYHLLKTGAHYLRESPARPLCRQIARGTRRIFKVDRFR